jgi:beta-glucosidase
VVRRIAGIGRKLTVVVVLAALGLGAPAALAAPSPGATARALVARMTLPEKLTLLNGTGFTTGHAGIVTGIPRLGIPPLTMGDGPNGVGNGTTGVTAFPAAVNQAASFDPALARRYGRALGAEQAGKGNDEGLAPTVNILRSPLWGRASETLGEDPLLTSRIGVGIIDGIQSNHVIATVKHFVANNQETGRFGVLPTRTAVDARVAQRALHEIYYPAFRAAVRAGVGSVMCSYNRINGHYACENPNTLGDLRSWGFDGFVVSDWYFGTRSTVAAAKAGLDIQMPGTPLLGLPDYYGAPLLAAAKSGAVPAKTITAMATAVVTAMAKVGVLKHPPRTTPLANVSTAPHHALAQEIVERGSVLLRNTGGTLPLSPRRSVAVIGDAGGTGLQRVQAGSAATADTGGQTPVHAIRARVAHGGGSVTYARGTAGTGALPPLTPPGGLHATYYGTVDRTGPVLLSRTEPSVAFGAAPAGVPAASGWSARWTATFTPPTSGVYRYSLSGGGTASVRVAGKTVVRSVADLSTVAQGVVTLRAGVPVPIVVEYSSASAAIGANLAVGALPPDPALVAQAVAAARAAKVAVVFVSDRTGEGTDRTSLALPGDQDALVAAVAKANPHTVVVLNTGGPVLMPWRNRVAGILETWYPGQQAAWAIARLLYGDANPSGRLPETFPARDTEGPATTASRFPGVGGVARYSEGLLVGYRWFEARRAKPLYPFGFGLGYTRFRYDRLRVSRTGAARATVSVRVRNVGSRAGADVPQLYLRSPTATGEPLALRDFRRISLEPGRSTTVRLRIGPADVSTWETGRRRWTVRPGTYRVLVGASSADIRARGTLRVRG